MHTAPCGETRRILSIDPTSRGFGFAMLEGPDQLIDWGLRQARRNKNAGCLKLVKELIERYRPDVLAVEDCTRKVCRRCARVRKLIERIGKVGARRRVPVRKFSRLQVRRAFSQSAALTKDEIARSVAKHFPELARSLPPTRKPWLSEDERLAIFDAVAFALTLYSTQAQRRRKPRAAARI